MSFWLLTVESWLFHMTLAGFYYRIRLVQFSTGNIFPVNHQGVAHSDPAPVGNITIGCLGF
jgi:hypothetical protein